MESGVLHLLKNREAVALSQRTHQKLLSPEEQAEQPQACPPETAVRSAPRDPHLARLAALSGT